MGNFRLPPACLVYTSLQQQESQTRRRTHSLQVLLLVETWHDSDSVAIRRLRADGYSVIERARPRRDVDPLSVNHGGVAIVAASGIHLTAIDIGLSRQRSRSSLLALSAPHRRALLLFCIVRARLL